MATMVQTASLSAVPTSMTAVDSVPTEPIFRLNVEQYHAMIQAGILTDDDPVELLEGWLVSKMSKPPPHRVVTLLLRQALENIIADGWYVDSQEPITTIDSEPEPDVVVVRGHTLYYLDRHPGPEDIALVVEVADATLRRDRDLKKRLYARAGIIVYWIVDLQQKQIEVYSDPIVTGKLPDYRQRQIYTRADSIPVLIEGVEVGGIPVQELIP